ncbi:MAG: hypothetical protein JRI62_09640 [Deltaproteobacteria bacterium]|nr:hypothetical protein [Deltaproteobacteria bacterium]
MADQLQEQNPDQKRRQFWQFHLKAWSLTGLSQIEYCRQNDLRANRFTLFRNNEVHLRLTVGSKFTIEITDGFTPVTLEQVLLTLQGV